MRAEIDHAGRVVLAAETGSHALRLMFAGDGAPAIVHWKLTGFHSAGDRPVSVAFRLHPQGALELHQTASAGDGEGR
jgi:hypothetical protein